MSSVSTGILLLSDFSIDNLAGSLENAPDTLKVQASVAPYGQVIPRMLDVADAYAAVDYAIVWTRPECQIESFGLLQRYQAVEMELIDHEVDAFAETVRVFAKRFKYVFVPTWVKPVHFRGLGVFDLQGAAGLSHALFKMNARLMDRLHAAPNVCLLDTQKWISAAGPGALDPRLWYMAKVPFAYEVFKQAAGDIKSAMQSLAGRTRKLLLLDLDDTLWGEIIGETGLQNLRLGGHDPIGEAFQDFQRSIKALKDRGIILGVVSKNDEATALEAIRNHPEMVLKLDDFAGWRINWKDKAANILELVAELNLGLDSAVFIDDNPFERARVQAALPEVLVPDWPANKLFYCKALAGQGCFDVPSFTKEDRNRAVHYVAERQRLDLKNSVRSIDEWLQSLEIHVEAERLSASNLRRACQLLNKTNQMNLATRRMSEEQLRKWAADPAHPLWTFRVSDCFGDAGLTGIISLAEEGAKAEVVDFILSCRVIGRKVEETMLHTAITYARSIGVKEICAIYRPTSRNQPCLEFWRQSGFSYSLDENRFTWQVSRDYPKPQAIHLLEPAHAKGA